MTQGSTKTLNFHETASNRGNPRSSVEASITRGLEQLVSIAKPSGPDPRAPGTALGITEPMIERLVAEFYRRVRLDALLGPVFEAAVEDWDQHLGRMRDFWSSVVLMSGRYKGKPVLVHAKLPGLSAAHFRQWLALFDETARDVCPPRAAELFIDRAGRIAESLQLGIAVHSGGTGDAMAILPAPKPASNTTEFTRRT
jgi:hemoglobin